MTARIITLADYARQEHPARTPEERDFDRLFRDTRDLRTLVPEIPKDRLATMDWKKAHAWFQQELSAEVFHRKLFQRSVLVSLWFVSDLLVPFARGEHPDVGIAEHVSAYSRENDPGELLKAVNSAFLFFVFWPEMRTGRSVRYRQMAITYGPSLYISYADVTKKVSGYHMADAFESLSDIARERFAHA